MKPPKHHYIRHAFAGIFCLLLVFIALPFTTHADTLDVTARINAPLPTSPAIITSPIDQDRLDDSPIIVSGTCGDGAYVVLYLNGAVVGSGVCSGGNFSIQTPLVLGENRLQAKVYNSTDNEGPQSPVVTVYYEPKQAAPPLVPPAFITPGNVSPSDEPIFFGDQLYIIYTPTGYRVYQTNEVWRGELSVHGGSRPYDIVIDWGDDTLFHFVQNTSDPFSITHAYSRPGSYQPVITARDRNGLTTSLQLFVVVVQPEVQDLPPPEGSILPLVATVIVGLVALAVLVTEIGSILGAIIGSWGASPPKK